MWRRAMVIGLSMVACGGEATGTETAEVTAGAAGTASAAGAGGGAGQGQAGKASAGAAGKAGAGPAGAAGSAGAGAGAAGAAGTQGDLEPFDFHYDLTPPGGMSHGLWHVVLKDIASGETAREWFSYGEITQYQGWGFKVLRPGHSYRFAYFIDEELDLTCSAPPDLARQLIFDSVDGPLDFQLAAEEGDPGSCEDHVPSTTQFHLFVDVDGFTKEEANHRLKYNLGGGKYEGDTFATPQTLFFEQTLAKDKPYKLQMFVDLNNDGACDPAVDHAWLVTVPASSETRFIDFSATTAQDPAGCFTPQG